MYSWVVYYMWLTTVYWRCMVQKLNYKKEKAPHNGYFLVTQNNTLEISTWFSIWPPTLSVVNITGCYFLDYNFHTIPPNNKSDKVAVWQGIECTQQHTFKDPILFQLSPPFDDNSSPRTSSESAEASQKTHSQNANLLNQMNQFPFLRWEQTKNSIGIIRLHLRSVQEDPNVLLCILAQIHHFQREIQISIVMTIITTVTLLFFSLPLVSWNRSSDHLMADTYQYRPTLTLSRGHGSRSSERKCKPYSKVLETVK